MNRKFRGFTVVELLAAMAIVVTLGALCLGAVQNGIKQAKAVECLSNLRQLGSSAMLYAADNNQRLPMTVHQRKSGVKSWTLTLQEYAGGTIVFRCPADEDRTRPYTYVINDFLTPNPAGAPDIDYSRLPSLERPSKTFLFAEASQNYTDADHFHFASYRGQSVPVAEFANQVAVKRHHNSSQFVFADGHVESLTWPAVQELLQTPGNALVDPTVAGTQPN